MHHGPVAAGSDAGHGLPTQHHVFVCCQYLPASEEKPGSIPQVAIMQSKLYARNQVSELAGKLFDLDETITDILNQVRNEAFHRELDERLALVERLKKAAIELAESKIAGEIWKRRPPGRIWRLNA